MEVTDLKVAYDIISVCEYDCEESVMDTFDGFPISISTVEFANALLKEGVIPERIAKQYIEKYERDNIEFYDGNAYEYTEQAMLLTNRRVDDGDIDYKLEDRLSVLYAVILLYDKTFREAVLTGYAEFLEQHDQSSFGTKYKLNTKFFK